MITDKVFSKLWSWRFFKLTLVSVFWKFCWYFNDFLFFSILNRFLTPKIGTLDFFFSFLSWVKLSLCEYVHFLLVNGINTHGGSSQCSLKDSFLTCMKEIFWFKTFLPKNINWILLFHILFTFDVLPWYDYFVGIVLEFLILVLKMFFSFGLSYDQGRKNSFILIILVK